MEYELLTIVKGSKGMIEMKNREWRKYATAYGVVQRVGKFQVLG